jgi:spore coat protein M
VSTNHHDDKDAKSNDFDKLMEQFFLDPNTSVLDQFTFRIDVYECNEEYVVEALFNEKKPKKIKIRVNGDQLLITALVSNKHTLREVESLERTVPFPFPINRKKITAAFSNAILEIKVSKKTDTVSSEKEIMIDC